MKTVNMGSSAYGIPVANDSATHTSFDDLSVPFHTSAPIPHGESNGNRPDFFEGYKSAADKLTEDAGVPDSFDYKDKDEDRTESVSKKPTGPLLRIASSKSSSHSSLNPKKMNDSTGPTGKKFTESLHERKPDGKFEETTKKSKVERSGDDK